MEWLIKDGSAEAVQRAQLRRATGLLVALIVFCGAQLLAHSASVRIDRGTAHAYDALLLLAPGLLALKLARVIFDGPAWLLNARARRALNDELARDNQRRATIAGLHVAALTAFALACAAPFLHLNAYDVAQLVLFALVAPAVVRFAWLEVRGAKGP
jgi:hypothetical protein